MSVAQANAVAEEDIEGLGDREETGWGEYPIDTVLIRTETRTVFDVVRRIEQGSFVMNPDFQRDFIWSEEKQSKLIESVLMRIPLPVFYLAEDEQGHMVVVDGLQRLSTFQRFFQNRLKLKLPGQANLHKKRFEDLSPKLQNRVEDCNLVLYIIDAKVPERARLDIFERVNGGVPLTRQQMRNCLYMGPATRFLKEESATGIFLEATGGSLRTSTMRDREFVNRFCAFRLLAIDDYKGDMDEFLAAALRKMNKIDSGDIKELSNEFQTSLTTHIPHPKFQVCGRWLPASLRCVWQHLRLKAVRRSGGIPIILTNCRCTGDSSSRRRRVTPLCLMITMLSSSKHSRMLRPVGARLGRFSG